MHFMCNGSIPTESEDNPFSSLSYTVGKNVSEFEFTNRIRYPQEVLYCIETVSRSPL